MANIIVPLALEQIGSDDTYAHWDAMFSSLPFPKEIAELMRPPRPGRPWVAEITGLDPRYKFSRKFLDRKLDYSKSNSAGSRGIEHWFFLEEGRTYEVYHRSSWKRSERYFCTVSHGRLITITEEEVTRRCEEG